MSVTVLMAVLNGRAIVRQAIESIMEQTYTDWELCVIDDASHDGTPDVLETFAAAEPRIRVIRNPRTRGLAACMNAGWRATTGQFIARMDADDASLRDRLERQVRFLESHPDVAVVGTGAELFDESGRRLGMALRPSDHETLLARIFLENPFIHPSVMMRRTFLDSLGGYDERLSRAQDYDLWLRGARRFRYSNLEAPLIRYRVRRRPSMQSILWGTVALARGGYRERQLLRGGWGALRFLVAGLLAKAHLRQPDVR